MNPEKINKNFNFSDDDFGFTVDEMSFNETDEDPDYQIHSVIIML